MKIFNDYKDAEIAAVNLYYEGKNKEAIELLKDIWAQYPHMEHEIAWSLALHYTLTGAFDLALETFEDSLGRGVFFPFPPAFDVWKPLGEHAPARFDKILERTALLREQAQSGAQACYHLELPFGYSPYNKYPLLVVLHGWAGDMSFSKRHWQAPVLESNFITIYVQSSQVVMSKGYGWDNMPQAKREIGEIYKEVSGKYSVDEDKVVLAGFSQGGMLALDLLFGGIIPARGFLALCPGDEKPGALTRERVMKLSEQGAHGVILSGERDSFLPLQKEITALLEKWNFPVKLTINPDMAHWFPRDFEDQLEKALAHLIG